MRKKLDLAEKLKKLTNESKETPVLRAIDAAEIELRDPRSAPPIDDFELELEGATVVAPMLDKAMGEHLEQLLSLQGGKEVKWTASLDPYAEKFASMVEEGLLMMKTQPPVYGSRFRESAILASHMAGYTFTLASYEIEFDKLVEVFTSALKQAKEKLTLS